MAKRLHEQRGLSACAATAWNFFAKRGITLGLPEKPGRRLQGSPL
jgi:hypothetical protein